MMDLRQIHYRILSSIYALDDPEAYPRATPKAIAYDLSEDGLTVARILVALAHWQPEALVYLDDAGAGPAYRLTYAGRSELLEVLTAGTLYERLGGSPEAFRDEALTGMTATGNRSQIAAAALPHSLSQRVGVPGEDSRGSPLWLLRRMLREARQMKSVDNGAETYQCSRCGRLLPSEAYSRRSDGAMGMHRQCRQCRRTKRGEQ